MVDLSVMDGDKKVIDRQMAIEDIEAMEQDAMEGIDLNMDEALDMQNLNELDAEMDIALNQYDYDAN